MFLILFLHFSGCTLTTCSNGFNSISSFFRMYSDYCDAVMVLILFLHFRMYSDYLYFQMPNWDCLLHAVMFLILFLHFSGCILTIYTSIPPTSQQTTFTKQWSLRHLCTPTVPENIQPDFVSMITTMQRKCG